MTTALLKISLMRKHIYEAREYKKNWSERKLFLLKKQKKKEITKVIKSLDKKVRLLT